MGDGSRRRDDAQRDQGRHRGRHADGRETGEGAAARPRRARPPARHLLPRQSRFTGVDIGDEVVLSFDGSGNADVGDRVTEMSLYETHHGADMLELWNIDYSYKAIKTIVSYEANLMKDVQAKVTAPCNYGAMPDLGRYSQPDGPIPNWSELMPLGRIDEAREAQVEAVDHLVADMVFVADHMDEAGADGLDFDTAAAAGDADFLATLTAIRRIRDTFPDLGAEMGMASEMTLGMHGQLEYEGTRLAGLWPREQMKVAEKAGVTIFGPAVNVNTTKSDRLERGTRDHARQAVLRGGHDPRPHERRHGGRGDADEPLPAGRRRVADLAGDGRHPAARWLVGGRGRSAGHGVHARACLGNGRDASGRRPGRAHATDPGHAAQAGEGVRGRQARRLGDRPLRPDRHARRAGRAGTRAASRCRSSPTRPTRGRWRRSSASPRCSTYRSTVSPGSGSGQV